VGAPAGTSSTAGWGAASETPGFGGAAISGIGTAAEISSSVIGADWAGRLIPAAAATSAVVASQSSKRVLRMTTPKLRTNTTADSHDSKSSHDSTWSRYYHTLVFKLPQESRSQECRAKTAYRHLLSATPCCLPAGLPPEIFRGSFPYIGQEFVDLSKTLACFWWQIMSFLPQVLPVLPYCHRNATQQAGLPLAAGMAAACHGQVVPARIIMHG
jgi:hypothetical protein